VNSFLARLGEGCHGPGTVYVVGGASALLLGWRATTVDIDLKFEPEPLGAIELLPGLKRELSINIELASPDLFVPVPGNWRERSVFIVKHNQVSFFHFDFRSQALAKIERGTTRDLADVSAMVSQGVLTIEELRGAWEEVKEGVLRYPHLEPDALAHKVEQALEALGAKGGQG